MAHSRDTIIEGYVPLNNSAAHISVDVILPLPITRREVLPKGSWLRIPFLLIMAGFVTTAVIATGTFALTEFKLLSKDANTTPVGSIQHEDEESLSDDMPFEGRWQNEYGVNELINNEDVQPDNDMYDAWVDPDDMWQAMAMLMKVWHDTWNEKDNDVAWPGPESLVLTRLVAMKSVPA